MGSGYGNCLGPWMPCKSRIFLNLGFAKPMFYNLVLFTRTRGITKRTKRPKTTQTATSTGVDCWIRRNQGKHGNDENHENPGEIKGSPKPRFRKTRKSALQKKKNTHTLGERQSIAQKGVRAIDARNSWLENGSNATKTSVRAPGLSTDERGHPFV